MHRCWSWSVIFAKFNTEMSHCKVVWSKLDCKNGLCPGVCSFGLFPESVQDKKEIYLLEKDTIAVCWKNTQKPNVRCI